MPKIETVERGTVALGTLKAEYDRYFERAIKVNKFGKYTYTMLFLNIFSFLKKKGFDPTKQY